MIRFPRVTHSRDVFQVRSVLAEKPNQMRSVSVPETEHHSLVDFLRCCVSSHSPEDREPFCGGGLDGLKVALFQIRPDSVPSGSKMNHMPLDVTLHAERQVHKGFSPADATRVARKDSSQLLCLLRKPRGPLL